MRADPNAPFTPDHMVAPRNSTNRVVPAVACTKSDRRGPLLSPVTVSCLHDRRRLLSSEPTAHLAAAADTWRAIWSLRHDHVTWGCELRFHGESYGWEAQILREGKLVIGQRFALRQIAEAWAEAERQILVENGGT
jgi:hypothetical protein